MPLSHTTLRVTRSMHVYDRNLSLGTNEAAVFPFTRRGFTCRVCRQRGYLFISSIGTNQWETTSIGHKLQFNMNLSFLVSQVCVMGSPMCAWNYLWRGSISAMRIQKPSTFTLHSTGSHESMDEAVIPDRLVWHMTRSTFNARATVTNRSHSKRSCKRLPRKTCILLIKIPIAIRSYQTKSASKGQTLGTIMLKKLGEGSKTVLASSNWLALQKVCWTRFHAYNT